MRAAVASTQRRLLPPTGTHLATLPILLPSTTVLKSIPFISNTSTSQALSKCTQSLVVSGPKGQMTIPMMPYIKLDILPGSGSDLNFNKSLIINQQGDYNQPVEDTASQRHVKISVLDAWDKSQRAMWATTRSLVASAIHGVTHTYTSTLKLVGVGYKARIENDYDGNKLLIMKLGYGNEQHDVKVNVWSNLDVQVPQPTRILVSGVDKQKIGLFCAKIRRFRVPEVYNGKGIFVNDETVRRKEAKKK